MSTFDVHSRDRRLRTEPEPPARRAEPASRTARYRRAFSDLVPFLSLCALPLLMWTWAMVVLIQNDNLAYDFHQFFYPQARALVHGGTPATAYPPLASLLYAPLSILPRGAADVAATVVMITATGGTLWLLGVRDWRCYGAAALWEPVFAATQTANLTQVLGLGLAAMWRWRDRRLVAGSLVAALVALKLFLWPVAGWLWATGRRREVATMAVFALLASVAAWSLVGLSAVQHFPDAVRGNVVDNGHKPYTIAALVSQLGADPTLAYALTWAAGLTTLMTGLRLAGRGQETEGLTLTIGSSLLLSPIVWTPYLSLLLIPMALTRPRFGPAWLAPLPLWVVPQVGGSPQSKVIVLTLGAMIFANLGGFGARSTPSEPRVTPSY